MKWDALRVFEEPLAGSDGESYVALVCGRSIEGGGWEGWIEFIPERGGPILRSQRETRQSSLRTLEGWASRLGRVYLEGSLERTLYLEKPRRRRPPPEIGRPRFEGPAPWPGSSRTTAPDDAVLSPFLHYHRGEAALRAKLEELSAADLRAVTRAYGLDGPAVDVAALDRPELIEHIVRSVRKRMQE